MSDSEFEDLFGIDDIKRQQQAQLGIGLFNSIQNKNSLELQREILAMQKLQVLNQVRISAGLPPLAELPQPPKPPQTAPPDFSLDRVALVILFMTAFGFGIFCICFYVFAGK